MTQEINKSSGNTKSCWFEIARHKYFPKIDCDIKTDVAIVGGGIAGLSCAYSLAKRGKSVIVIEDGLIGSGETGRTSAHLSSYVDGRINRLVSLFGVEKTKLIIESHQKAIDYIEDIISLENIDCDFKRVNGYLFTLHDEQILAQEALALSQIRNLPFQRIEQAPLSFTTGPCLKMPNQAQFHPLRYLYGLAEAVIKYGGQIFEGSHVKNIKDGKPCEVLLSLGHKIIAKDVIVATHSPINDRVLIHTKQAQYRTYIVGIALPQNNIEEALYWDTEEPYHYIRTVKDYLIVGGNDHRVGHENEKNALLKLRRWVLDNFKDVEFVYEWSGQVIESIDALAFCGKNPFSEHIYVHTASSGSGLTYGTIAGMILPDLIMGNHSPWEKIYSPRRKTIKAIGEYGKDIAIMGASYADWLRPQINDLSSLKPNQGMIKRQGLSFEAIYKDLDGKLHRMSALCPHLGGVVRWNNLEKTWDCPCHGSRFNVKGEVICSPANKPLKKL